jgi:hypothetical protein
MASASHGSETARSPSRAAPAQTCSARVREAAGVPPAGHARKQSETSNLAFDARPPRHAVGWMALCLEI